MLMAKGLPQFDMLVHRFSFFVSLSSEYSLSWALPTLAFVSFDQRLKLDHEDFNEGSALSADFVAMSRLAAASASLKFTSPDSD